MRTFARTIAATAITAALLLVPAAAQANGLNRCGVHQDSGDNFGILNGLQLFAPIDIPIDLSHNALGILGGAATYDIGRHHHHRHHHHRRYCD